MWTAWKGLSERPGKAVQKRPDKYISTTIFCWPIQICGCFFSLGQVEEWCRRLCSLNEQKLLRCNDIAHPMILRAGTKQPRNFFLCHQYPSKLPVTAYTHAVCCTAVVVYWTTLVDLIVTDLRTDLFIWVGAHLQITTVQEAAKKAASTIKNVMDQVKRGR